MSVPANILYTQGTGAPAVTADNLNSFVQTVTTLTVARGFTGTANQQIFLQGYSSANDGGQGNFVWIVGTGTDDSGVTTIIPTGNTSGYWSRIGNSSAVRTPQTVNNAAGVTLSAANMINQVLLRTGAAGVTDTTPTAAAIIAAINVPYGAQAGSMRDLLVVNENSGTYLIAPGSGVTLAGNLSTGNFSISTPTQRMFQIYIASASAVTIYG